MSDICVLLEGIHRRKQSLPKRTLGKLFTYDPISPVAVEIGNETCLLCFDEFQVSTCILCSLWVFGFLFSSSKGSESSVSDYRKDRQANRCVIAVLFLKKSLKLVKFRES